jgi:hypothetical protein
MWQVNTLYLCSLLFYAPCDVNQTDQEKDREKGKVVREMAIAGEVVGWNIVRQF